MNILLVEDEAGIREGLAMFLRLKGHVVRDASSCAEGRELAQNEDFDLAVTDWRLGDGLGKEVADSCECPVVVMTGFPGEVSDVSRMAGMLCKPVSPSSLLSEVERLHLPPSEPARRGLVPEGVPRDTRDRIELAWHLSGRDPGGRMLDQGDSVVLQTELRIESEQALGEIEQIGGDLRVLDSKSGRRLELRLYRDGRPDGARVIRFDDPWPERSDAPLAIDLEGAAVDPATFVALVQKVDTSNAGGRAVYLLNIPPHLRLHAEILGMGHQLPKRPKSGPRLPEVLMELWRRG